MTYLKFISDKNLITAVNNVIQVIEKAENRTDENMYKNVIDPFSALFHGITKCISCKNWMDQEKARQTQKTNGCKNVTYFQIWRKTGKNGFFIKFHTKPSSCRTVRGTRFSNKITQLVFRNFLMYSNIPARSVESI